LSKNQDYLTEIQFRNFEQNPNFTGKTPADYAIHLGLPLTLETERPVSSVIGEHSWQDPNINLIKMSEETD